MTASDHRTASWTASGQTASATASRTTRTARTASGRPPAVDRQPAASGFGWGDRQRRQPGRQRHAGIGDRAALERQDERDEDERDEVDSVADEDRDDAGEVTHHIVVPATSGPLATVDRAPAPGLMDDTTSPRQRLALARRGDYALHHLRVVRALHTAWYWVGTFTTELATAGMRWAAASFWRALTVAVIALTAAQAVPVLPWLVIGNWSSTTWWCIGGFAALFAAATGIAAAVDRQAERAGELDDEADDAEDDAEDDRDDDAGPGR